MILASLTFRMWYPENGQPQSPFKSLHIDQCPVRGLRALKNVMGCGFVVEASLFIQTNEDREGQTHTDFVAPKNLGVLHPLTLEKLRA